MGWHAYISGGEFDLNILLGAFPEGDVTVGQDEHGFYVYGTSMDSLAEPAEVLLEAQGLLPLLNGVGRAIETGFKPVQVSGRVWDGKGPAHVLAEAHLRARSWLLVGASWRTPARDLLAKAGTDPSFDSALRLFGASPDLDWVDLYKIYELLRHAAGGMRGLMTILNISDSELSAFTASANRPDVSGSEARHAHQSGATPKRAMSLDEGRAFIRRVITNW